jgi:DNA-binding IclR family transcriptional regulator
MVEEVTGRQWTFFTHHAHVLLSLARDPTLRLRDIAGAVGVTERATATLVSELVHAGYLQRFKDGRRNRYRVDLSGGLRHPLVEGASVAEVFEPLLPAGHSETLATAEQGA